MSETERRTGYVLGRILIDVERILSPQFGAQGVYLNGAQVELLRNVVAYLGRDTTFVDEYAGHYYLKVTADDFDDISAIVADLEDKLSTNDNTLWGYHERWADEVIVVSDSGTLFWVNAGAVPSGEVWVLENALVYHNQGGNVTVQYGLYADPTLHYVVPAFTVPNELWHGGPTNVTLGAGDLFVVVFAGLDVGKTARLHVTGYKMKVPA